MYEASGAAIWPRSRILLATMSIQEEGEASKQANTKKEKKKKAGRFEKLRALILRAWSICLGKVQVGADANINDNYLFKSHCLSQFGSSFHSLAFSLFLARTTLAPSRLFSRMRLKAATCRRHSLDLERKQFAKWHLKGFTRSTRSIGRTGGVRIEELRF